MSYIKRIIEEDLSDMLSASGAVLIKGPKSCGKTATAKQKDIKYTGFLFESLATHELNVYAKANDAIVQKRNGDYAAFEIKLGVGYIDEAAENLKKFARNIDTSKMDVPKSLNIKLQHFVSKRKPLVLLEKQV